MESVLKKKNWKSYFYQTKAFVVLRRSLWQVSASLRRNFADLFFFRENTEREKPD